jgi:hypothetical protein
MNEDHDARITMGDDASEFIGASTIVSNLGPAKLVFCGAAGVVLFTICHDGSIERGPGFTTVDEMSLKFWQTVDSMRPRAL